MELTPMQYKDYTWPHNPRTYTIRYERRVALHKIPLGRYALQDLGLTRRIMTGEGEFWGEGAYDEFRKLATVFYGGGPGTLIHPVWQTAQAYFVELSLTQEPRKDYVRYTFTFWEDHPGGQGSLPQGTDQGQPAEGGDFHILAQGETLYALADRYGLSLEALLALNPQIANPSQVTPGQTVRVG